MADSWIDNALLAPTERERKFLVPATLATVFLDAVAGATRVEIHDPSRPVAYARTTYLDTPQLRYLRSSTSGVAKRLRIREYASAPDLDTAPVLTGECFLELKESADSLRSKCRFSAPPEVIAALVQSSGALVLAGDEQQGALGALVALLREDAPAPRMTTWYRRVSRSGENGRVRITVDDGLCFARPRPVGLPGRLAAPAPEDIVAAVEGRVVELKYRGEAPRWLVDALRLLPEALGYSKFRAGMAALAEAAAAECESAGSEA